MNEVPDGCHMAANCITALEQIIDDRQVKTVLEFGSGFSTYWFSCRVEKVYTVEWNYEWIPHPNNNITVIYTPRADEYYLGTLDFLPQCDLILIDCSKLNWRINIYKAVRNWDWKVLCIHDWKPDYPDELYDGLETNQYGSLKVYLKAKENVWR